MAINTILTAEKYSDALDKAFVQKSVTGFFADNALRTKFVGAKTVIIPDIDFAGLVDYDRDTGFARGALTIANTPFTMEMDRARSIQIDREDEDETGIANLAGQILGEYVRTKVVPECDAHVLSKIFAYASSANNTAAYTDGKVYEQLTTAITNVRKEVGYDEELVAFVDSDTFAALENSPEISRHITVSDFRKGDINFKVKSVNGVALIPVVPERMKSAYTFVKSGDDAKVGGFTPTEGAKSIRIMVMPKSGAHLVKKTEKLRVFTPEQNLDADAYKFDYRIYYDVFVKKSCTDAIFAYYT
jgi:predicted transcriptional regulator